MSFSSGELVSVKRRAMRKRVWFGVLSRVERGIIDLTIRCVDRIRSPKLAEIVSAIVCKLKEVMESVVLRLTREVGRPLAQRLSDLAVAWGHVEAREWAGDPKFARYLAMNWMNTSRTFKGRLGGF